MFQVTLVAQGRFFFLEDKSESRHVKSFDLDRKNKSVYKYIMTLFTYLDSSKVKHFLFRSDLTHDMISRYFFGVN